jgi:hypothetical protein
MAELVVVRGHLITTTSHETLNSFFSLYSLLAQWIWGGLGSAHSFDSWTFFGPQEATDQAPERTQRMAKKSHPKNH